MSKYLVMASFNTGDHPFLLSICRQYQDDSDWIDGEKRKIANLMCKGAGMNSEDLYKIPVFQNGNPDECPEIAAHWTEDF